MSKYIYSIPIGVNGEKLKVSKVDSGIRLINIDPWGNIDDDITIPTDSIEAFISILKVISPVPQAENEEV